MKKNIKGLFVFLVSMSLMAACQYDPNKDFDMYSPQAFIPVDTFEVAPGTVVTLKATLSDDSGLESCMLEYGAWEVSEEIRLKDQGSPSTYDFQVEVQVPVDAELSWKENYQKHDGTIFEVTQTYHKLSLTFYDAVKNKNVVYFYIKVNP